MLTMPTARPHHRSRIGYALGLLTLVGAATMLVVVVRYPAEATRLAEPVPAPEITVVQEGNAPPEDPLPGDDVADGAAAGSGLSAYDETGGGVAAGQQAGGRDGDATSTAAGRSRQVADQQTLSQSLFYSGLLGLAISLAGLGLVGTRRRMW